MSGDLMNRPCCSCDRCARWPDSEVTPTSRRWLAFEVVRPLDVVLAHGAASFTEAALVDQGEQEAAA